MGKKTTFLYIAFSIWLNRPILKESPISINAMISKGVGLASQKGSGLRMLNACYPFPVYSSCPNSEKNLSKP